ncbi:MAG: hypothetical protein ACTHK0_16980 [Ginsengibacter sp.]
MHEEENPFLHLSALGSFVWKFFLIPKLFGLPKKSVLLKQSSTDALESLFLRVIFKKLVFWAKNYYWLGHAAGGLPWLVS